MTTPLAEKLASLSGYGPTSSVAQAQYRLDLIAKWPIGHGARVLELGCGQGDTTLALAEAVGATGHVDAVDPARLDYGSPTTLGEAQNTISTGPLGPRIAWIQSEPLKYLKTNPLAQWDVVVLAHSLWYFDSPELILETLRFLASRTQKVCIAEWSLSGINATTHILSALTQAAMECRKPESESNIRTMVAPTRIKELAAQAGLKLVEEALVTPGNGVHDGIWETQLTLGAEFAREVEEFVKDNREKAVILAMRDAVQASMDKIGGIKAVETMDGWVGVFTV
ncbi:Methyltransf-25 domain-containing protein [Mycena indigotica]|uniref:Methyltransf-25 domain-containing protein n=1 Tax=Mycena indigotica TaxID=2126181 RepID=A0A8H6T8L6_9AGAR|nr:Methyltransf-25 domain-containing protein [Mycena indigotica]KAF7312221.1 Methyltransf-25 domain-containing protein [Mycena indigotica]